MMRRYWFLLANLFRLIHGIKGSVGTAYSDIFHFHMNVSIYSKKIEHKLKNIKYQVLNFYF